MEQVPLSANLEAIFRSRLVPVQVVDAKGKVIGTFVPRLTEDDVSPDAVVSEPPLFIDQCGQRRVSIRIAGNTNYPCLMAALAKGYRVCLEYTKLDKPVLHWEEFMPDYQAEQDGAYFSATSAEELLGLIAMQEVRGDKWRGWTADERTAAKRIHDTAQTFDTDGNLLPNE